METQPKSMAEIVPRVLAEARFATTQKSGERHCCLCGAAVAIPENKLQPLDVFCDQCAALRLTQAKIRLQERARILREERFSQVPVAFRNTRRDRLPFPEILDRALSWQFGAGGLLLYGITGCGKSRIAWEIVKREILANHSFKYLNSLELSRYPAMLMAPDQSAVNLAGDLVKCDLV